MKKALILTAVAILVVVAAPALAFHDDGVAHCNGCHTMHNSQNNAAMNFNALGTGPGTAPGTGYNDLLLFPNRTDVCLSCHRGSPSSYHIWSNAGPLSPKNGGATAGAGDFVFQEEDNIDDGHGGGDGACTVATCGPGNDETCDSESDCIAETGNWTWDNPLPGYAGGHTLVSGIVGTVVDPVLAFAPGGSFPSNDLACTSCHDPHGNSAYRLTYMDGQTYEGASTATTYTWPANATIVGTAISVFGNEGQNNHNVYKSGYSEWCGTCHGDFHAESGKLIHPSGEPLNGIAGIYNRYMGTWDCIDQPPSGGNSCGSGSQPTAYLVQVPFEDPGAAYTTSSQMGPSVTSKVVCVSCHRAHASSGPDSGRWDFSISGLAEDGHESGSYALPGPYGTDMQYQRSLCNKCHAQDEYDTLVDFDGP